MIINILVGIGHLILTSGYGRRKLISLWLCCRQFVSISLCECDPTVIIQ